MPSFRHYCHLLAITNFGCVALLRRLASLGCSTGASCKDVQRHCCWSWLGRSLAGPASLFHCDSFVRLNRNDLPACSCTSRHFVCAVNFLSPGNLSAGAFTSWWATFSFSQGLLHLLRTASVWWALLAPLGKTFLKHCCKSFFALVPRVMRFLFAQSSFGWTFNSLSLLSFWWDWLHLTFQLAAFLSGLKTPVDEVTKLAWCFCRVAVAGVS